MAAIRRFIVKIGPDELEDLFLLREADHIGSGREPTDDLDDPWGRADVWFKRAADEIEAVLEPFVALLLPTHSTATSA